jgi:hypothetical protein
MIGLFSAVKRDYGPAGVRVELGHVGVLPVWEDNNRNELASGIEKKPVIKPVLIDREIPALEARLDALNKAAGLSTTNAAAPVGGPIAEVEPGANGATPGAGSAGLTADQKKEFIEVTKRLKLLMDRRAQILARVGDDYVVAPPKTPTKP